MPRLKIGAALVSSDGKVLGRGRNLRVQKDSPIHHVSLSHFTPSLPFPSLPLSDFD